MRRSTLLALTSAGALAALPATAHAGWSDAQLASVDNARLEQADGASTAVDLSGDGRWVVFQTRASNFFSDDDPDPAGRMRQGGLFRFDRTAGAIALVADGDQLDEESGELRLRGAAAPSVSDDGRFVAFSSAQRLVPQDDNDNVDVYVRDMAVPLTPDRPASGAYQLVSARDGGEQPATYAPLDPPPPGGLTGSAVFPGQSISADGRFVAFRTADLASDLPALDGLDAPAGSVFVRDLQQRTTTLVSRQRDGAGSAGGALSPVVISRDGSTVAWVGEQGPLQTTMLGGESADPSARYYLWRRWADADARTRRVTGLADPDDPACPAGGAISFNPLATGPCYGPLTDGEATFGDISGRAPALSGDGWTVAYLTAAGERPTAADDGYMDVFVTSMRPGLSRKQATTAVTKGTTAANARANGDVESLALSADGRRVVLVTTRREFLPPAPALLSPVRASPPQTTELYALDVGRGIRRPLMPNGAEIDGGVERNPAISADGRTVVFATRAANLVRGDANELADVFVVQEHDDPPTGAPPVGIGEDPVDLDIGSDRELSARASSRADGALVVRASTPTAGALRVRARTRAVRARRATRRRAAVKAVRARQVASARGRAASATTVRLVLRLKGRDLAAVRAGRPLQVRVAVTLTPAGSGAPARTVTVSGTFRRARRAAGRGGARRVSTQREGASERSSRSR